MRARVFSVFAGLGKTYVGKKYSNVLDLQSNPYRYDYTNIKKEDYEKLKETPNRKVNPNWPNNFINTIKETSNKYDIILVSSSLDIREILEENNIPYTFILPSKDSKEILLERYRKRGNSKELIDNVMLNLDTWSYKEEDYNCPLVILDKDKYLEDYLKEEGLINDK